jgi:fructokinase
MMHERVVAIGEVLWDLLPSGRVMGGAPANFACLAKMLGAEVNLISRVGNDALGREVIERLGRAEIPSDTIGIDAELPTGTVSVELSADGQPRFTIHRNCAWDRIEVNDASASAAQRCDILCFGTLAQREEPSRRAIEQVIQAVRPETLRVLDINLRAPFFSRAIIERSLALANVLKLNDQELSIVVDLLGLSGQETVEQLAELANRYALRLIALTRGAAGSLLWSEGQCSEHPGIRVDVVDTVGAGDAFTATMAIDYLHRRDLDSINERANRVAAYVCTQPGAASDLPVELLSS